MIIRGNPAGSVKYWSMHLLRDDTNERVEVKEITGLLAEDLPTGLREMEAIADQSRSQGNFMYQANINPLADEHLTPEQWREAVDTLEKNLGLEGHQRIVVEHVKHGRQHVHVIWNRVDVDTLRVADMGGNWKIHEKTQQELENRFDLTPTPTPDAGARKTPPELWELRAAERSGIDRDVLKAEITDLWNKADSGRAFAAAIEERGYILAKGDRRDFCIVDRAGDAHSLARRLDGVTVKDVRERMADVDRDSLPTVTEARTEQREHRNAEFWQGVEEKRDASSAVKQEQWGKSRDAEIARVTDRDTKTPSLGVLNAATGAVESLGDFILGFLGGSSPAPAMPADQLQQIRAQRKALAALENIQDSIERGENLKPDDIKNLTPTHLENIRLRGDDYLRELIERMERERVHKIDYGRERER